MAGYQQPYALDGRLLSGVPLARRPVRLCNSETIDAWNERHRMAVALLLDGQKLNRWIVEIRKPRPPWVASCTPA